MGGVLSRGRSIALEGRRSWRLFPAAAFWVVVMYTLLGRLDPGIALSVGVAILVAAEAMVRSRTWFVQRDGIEYRGIRYPLHSLDAMPSSGGGDMVSIRIRRCSGVASHPQDIRKVAGHASQMHSDTPRGREGLLVSGMCVIKPESVEALMEIFRERFQGVEEGGPRDIGEGGVVLCRAPSVVRVVLGYALLAGCLVYVVAAIQTHSFPSGDIDVPAQLRRISALGGVESVLVVLSMVLGWVLAAWVGSRGRATLSAFGIDKDGRVTAWRHVAGIRRCGRVVCLHSCDPGADLLVPGSVEFEFRGRYLLRADSTRSLIALLGGCAGRASVTRADF